jgi:hypothetical protein
MGSFNFTPGQEPQLDVPTPDLPLPDVEGWFTGIIKSASSWLRSTVGFQFLQWLVSTVVGLVVTAALAVGGPAAAAVAKGFIEGEAGADDEFGRLAEVAIEGLLGIKVAIRGTGTAAGGAGRRQAASDIGDGILKGLFEAGAPTGADGLQPGDAGVRNYLSKVVGLGFEGWLQGWMMEMLSLGHYEKFGELKDILAQSLGLGRLSRRIMGPVADILIVKPYTWQLNERYRPELLNAGQLSRAVKKGRLTKAEASAELARQGWADKRIELLLAEDDKHLSASDLDYMIAREMVDIDYARAQLTAQGWPVEEIDRLLTVTQDQRLYPFRKQLVSEARSAYVSRDLEAGDFQRIVTDSGIPRDEQDMILLHAGLARELNVKHISEGDMEAAVKIGLKGIQDYRALLQRLGYSLDDIETKELLLELAIQKDTTAQKLKDAAAKVKADAAAKKAADAAAKLAEAAQRAADKGLSLAQVEQLVRAGKRSIAQYESFLHAQGYSDQDAQDLGDVLLNDINARAAAAARKAELDRDAAARKINPGQVEKAVKQGVLSLEDYQTFLAQNGYSAADQTTLVKLLRAELADAAEAEKAKAAAAAKLSARDVSLSELENAVRAGLQTVDAYTARLLKEGFTQDAADILTGLLQQQLTDDEAARQRRAQVAAAAAKKSLSLADLEKAVMAGVKTMADYRAAVSQLGFSVDDQDTLSGLLQLQLDAAKQAAAKRAAAAAALAQKHVSLADVERAVKLGVLTLDQYRAFLVAQQFAPGDVQILSNSLVAEVAAVEDAKAKRAAAVKAAPAKDVSESQMRQAVLDGIRPPLDYELYLRGSGYSAAAVDTLVSLLALELDQHQAAAARQAQVDGELGGKGISLGDFRAAVRAGLKSLDEYAAYLAQLGYGDDDVSTLGYLLESQMTPKQTGG